MSGACLDDGGLEENKTTCNSYKRSEIRIRMKMRKWMEDRHVVDVIFCRYFSHAAFVSLL